MLILIGMLIIMYCLEYKAIKTVFAFQYQFLNKSIIEKIPLRLSQLSTEVKIAFISL